MSANHSAELQEIKALLLEQRSLINALFPNEVDIAFITQRTGMTRQGVRKRLLENYEIEEDFWKKGSKIFMSKTTALQFLKLDTRGV
ncbi:hypothetical protein [Arcobacter sp. 15-2]|uniref:hypothetical protein n=1 Tax=Arcobacter sp. 15-2 TaxID=3374109 RepID=UPI00399D0FB9